MKKILRKSRSKSRKKQQGYDAIEWLDFDDEASEYEEDDEEYEDEEYDDEEYEDEEYADEEYDDEEYEDDEDADDEEYEDEEYEDDEEIDDEEYEDEEYEDEEVDDEEYEDEYYEDDKEIDDEEYEDEEYENDEEIDDEEDDDEEYEDEYYEDEDDIEDEEEYEELPAKGIKRIFSFFMNMSMVDHVVMFTGLVVLILAGVTGTMYVRAKLDEKQIETFAEVGEGIDSIPIIGESGLLAVSNAQSSKALADELEELEKEATQIDEETGKIEVVLNMTSIQKDLKIKFANKKSGKLIPNVEFVVEVSGVSGKSYTLKDEDKDGIIYEKDIAPGKYKVKITGPNDLKDYNFSKEAVDVTVKDTIEYKKVDVSDEVKTEAQVNVKAEDTKVNETVVESVNADTVEWVESTKTLIEGTEETAESYEKVERKEITDPETKSAIGFRLMTEEDTPTSTPIEVPTEPEESETPQQTPEKTKEPEETQAPEKTETPDPTKEPEATKTPDEVPVATPTKNPAASATPDEVPVITPSAKPTATPTKSPTASPTATPTKSPTKSPTPTPTGAKYDTKSNLKSNSGERLYVKEGDGKFREAKYADYYNKDIKVFYKKIKNTKGEYRYTGWQTIDGVTYFFDKNGNKVTGEQVIQGAKYNFNSDGSLNTGSGHLGIDVSKWNGNIDWNAVKNSGVSYVIIRCGYRGSTTGALIEDPMFRSNIKGAQNAGLKVGVYFFTQAVNEVEAVEEASMVLGLIKGYNISYPVFLDVEASNGRADGINASTRTAVCRAFCQTVQNSGYKAGVYANKTWLNSYMDAPSLAGYKIWLAQYAAAPTYNKTKYDMWQYSSKGKVSGISGNVDMNISYLGY